MDITEIQQLIAAMGPLLEGVTDGATRLALVYVAFKLLIELLIPLVCLMVVRKAIVFVYQWAVLKKTTVMTHNVLLNENIVSNTDTRGAFEQLFSMARTRTGRNTGSNYIHADDVTWLIDCVYDAVLKERTEKARQQPVSSTTRTQRHVSL